MINLNEFCSISKGSLLKELPMSFFQSLLNYLTMSSPYLLMGLFFGGIIHEFLPTSKVKKWLGGNKLSHVIKAALVGVPLPLCSCSVIPTAVSLRKSGASKAATSSFLIATPESGVDSISVTYALMDLPMAIIRPLAAFTSAFFAGLLQIVFNKEDQIGLEQVAAKTCCSKIEKEIPLIVSKNLKQKFQSMIRFGFHDLINDIALWLAIGLIAGAFIDFFVPPHFFSHLSATSSRFLMVIVGVPLYICASATTPIAVALVLKGMSPGTALVLLLVGPATNIANIAVLRKSLGNKAIVLNIFAIVFVAIVFSYLVDYFYNNLFTLNFAYSLTGHDHNKFSWWEYLCSIFLVILIIKGIWIEEINPRFFKKPHKH
jgi:uncharacterized membrane protein YraQ (UPF0718 family)